MSSTDIASDDFIGAPPAKPHVWSGRKGSRLIDRREPLNAATAKVSPDTGQEVTI